MSLTGVSGGETSRTAGGGEVDIYKAAGPKERRFQ
jgi:hypothetical protein